MKTYFVAPVLAFLNAALLSGCGPQPDEQIPSGSSTDEPVASVAQASTAAITSSPIVGLFGKCVSVRGTTAAVGAALEMRPCVQGPDQSWERTAAGAFRGIGGKCIRAQGGSFTNNTPLVLADCVASDLAQKWTPALGGILGNGKSWHVAGASTASGAGIVVFDPSGGQANERWAYQTTEVGIRVHVVAVRNDDGSAGPSATPQQVASWVDQSNKYLKQAGLRLLFNASDPSPDWSDLRHSGVNALNRHGSGDSAAATAHALQWKGKLVVFLVEGESGGGHSGGGHEYVAFQNKHDNAARFYFPHEVGHYLGLPHTHSDAANMLPSNFSVLQVLIGVGHTAASFDGDGIADTPPDPGRSAYTGSGIDDCNGGPLTFHNVTFAPDKSNMMSYWGTCSSDPEERTITPSQIDKMRHVLDNDSRRTHLRHDSLPAAVTAAGALKTRTGAPGMLVGGDGRIVNKSKTGDSNSPFTFWKNTATHANVNIVVGVNNTDGTGQIFYAASGGKASTSFESTSGSWSSLVPFDHTIVADMATNNAADGRARLYRVLGNGNVDVRQKASTSPTAAWSSPQPFTMAGHVAKAITAGTLPDGREEVFILDANGSLLTSWQITAGGTWSTWHPMTSVALKDISVAKTTDGRMQLFGVTNAEGKVQEIHKFSTDPNASWTTWADLNNDVVGFSKLEAFRLQDGRPQVVAVRSGTAFSIYWQAAGGWSVWLGA
jgi:hypothetical protein